MYNSDSNTRAADATPTEKITFAGEIIPWLADAQEWIEMRWPGVRFAFIVVDVGDDAPLETVKIIQPSTPLRVFRQQRGRA